MATRLSCSRRNMRNSMAATAALAFAAALALPAAAASARPTPTTTAPGRLAAAEAQLAPYVGHPSAFPVTQMLKRRPPAGSRFIYLQCSTPICALLAQLLVGPTKALGAKLTIINSGSTATSSQSAAAAALADKPAAVLLPAVDPELFGNALHKLRAAGVVVDGVGIIGGAPYGVQDSAGGASSVALAGKLMADWVAVHKGAKANIVFFGTPELNFSPLMQAGFKNTLASVCPSCKTDYQQLSVETFGSTAPQQVVSYLQAHPHVNTAVFASMEGATGLAAALKDAHLSVTTLGFAPSPSNLQDIRDGGLTAGLGLDLLVQEWAQVDMTARLVTGQPVAPSELNVDLEFLDKNNVTKADTVLGWTGYPDVRQRFAKLWPEPR